MHVYAIDRKNKGDVRREVTYIIAILSLVVVIFLDNILPPSISMMWSSWENDVKWKEIVKVVGLTGIIPNVFSTAVIYKIIYWLYDECIWKCSLIKKWHNVPDLNGVWRGKLKSSYNNEIIDMKMEIIQTWTNITFLSTFKNSNSKSSNATIFIESEREVEIFFVYHNQSSDPTYGTQSYDGCNKLSYDGDSKIEAVYFNNRPNNKSKYKGGNIGHFKLIREDIVI